MVVCGARGEVDEGGDGVMVILVGEERWDTWNIKGLNLVLCFETYSKTVKELFHLL